MRSKPPRSPILRCPTWKLLLLSESPQTQCPEQEGSSRGTRPGPGTAVAAAGSGACAKLGTAENRAIGGPVQRGAGELITGQDLSSAARLPPEESVGASQYRPTRSGPYTS